jgi:hypothetical protein
MRASVKTCANPAADSTPDAVRLSRHALAKPDLLILERPHCLGDRLAKIALSFNRVTRR